MNQEKGNDCILDCSVLGGGHLRQIFPNQLLPLPGQKTNRIHLRKVTVFVQQDFLAINVITVLNIVDM